MFQNIKHNVPLSSLSTFGIGGKATSLVLVKTPEELVEVVSFAQKEKLSYKVFAGGSNVVFPDQGIDVLLIQVLGGNIAGNKRKLIADAGTPLNDLMSKSIDLGLSGLESLSGIPGTVGGAVVGNAGAYGHSISEVIKRVEIWDGKRSYWLSKKDCEFSYRESIFKKKSYLILHVECTFGKGDKAQLIIISQNIIEMRKKKYHPGIKCPGSFFKNVLLKDLGPVSLGRIDQSIVIDRKIPAGYLLSEVGARGMKVGGIEIADFHGNLFINRGDGTSKDVKELAKVLKRKVKEKFEIDLVEEIRYF